MRWDRRFATLFPVATTLILAGICAAYWLDMSTREHTGVGPEPLPERWVFDGEHPKAIQFVSYVFIHANRAHLESNCVVLLFALSLCELRVGPARLVALFVLSAIGTAAGFHLIDSRDLYGASGVAAAMIVAAAVLWSTHRKTHSAWRVGPSMLALAYFGLTEVLPAIKGHPNRSWPPHATGAAMGLLLGVLFSIRLMHKPTTTDNTSSSRVEAGSL